MVTGIPVELAYRSCRPIATGVKIWASMLPGEIRRSLAIGKIDGQQSGLLLGGQAMNKVVTVPVRASVVSTACIQQQYSVHFLANR